MIENDIKLAKDIINGNENSEIHRFSQLYPFTNENLKDYLGPVDFTDKKVLTVGSSLDQTFNLINYNCQDITVVDLSPFTKYYYELKKATILNLERTAFFRYLCYNDFSFFSKNKLVFNEDDYSKIAGYLDSDTKLFWDSLYSEFKPIDIRKKLFKDESVARNSIITNNEYLTVSNYHRLRDKIANSSVKFVVSDIQDYNLEKEVYDYMVLSNIFDYILNLINGENLDKETLEKYKNLIIELSRLLKQDGVMFAHYFYNCDENETYTTIRNFLVGDSRFSRINLSSNHGIKKDYDTMLVYTKK